jgi:hypothetical protein
VLIDLNGHSKLKLDVSKPFKAVGVQKLSEAVATMDIQRARMSCISLFFIFNLSCGCSETTITSLVCLIGLKGQDDVKLCVCVCFKPLTVVDVHKSEVKLRLFFL